MSDVANAMTRAKAAATDVARDEMRMSRLGLQDLLNDQLATLLSDAERDLLRRLGDRVDAAIAADDVDAFAEAAMEVHATTRAVQWRHAYARSTVMAYRPAIEALRAEVEASGLPSAERIRGHVLLAKDAACEGRVRDAARWLQGAREWLDREYLQAASAGEVH